MGEPLNTTLSHYRILSKIGAGGGEVYQAEDTRLNRKVALKLCCLCSVRYALTDVSERRFWLQGNPLNQSNFTAG